MKNDRRINHTLRATVARGLAQLTEAERRALAFERHRAADPHCTCNDCIAAHAGVCLSCGQTVCREDCEGAHVD